MKTIWQSLNDQARAMSDRALADVTTLPDWERVRPKRRQEFMHDLGLDPLPPRCELKLTDHGTFAGQGYTARRIAFQILPDCWSSACLYYPDPLPAKRAPAVLYVCGHATIGAWHYQYHPMLWARRGYVCLILDTVEQHDNRGEHHGSLLGRFGAWLALGYTPAGAEVWNAMRAADVLVADPHVDPQRLGVTGVSGGGACSFHTAVADERFRAVSTLCGISSPLDALVNHHLCGHCDCMYPHNLYARDISEYAALIAPRAGLFCFTEQDCLYHVAENRALVERARHVWRLHEKPDACQTVTCPGPHGDHPVFDRATAQWFDRYVAQEARPPLERGERELPESVTSVFNGQPPRPDQLELLPHLLRPRGGVSLPRSVDDWPQIRRAARQALLDAAPSLRPAALACALQDSGRWEWGAQTYMHTHRGELGEQAVELQYVMPAEGRPTLVISIAGEGEEAAHALARIGCAVEPQATGYGAFQPRVAGYQSLPASSFAFPPGSTLAPLHTVMLRAMALTGVTPVSLTVQDLRLMMDYLKGLDALQSCAIYLLAAGEMAVAALYAALLDDRIAGVVLQGLPSSHLDGGPILGVLRALDIPQAVGLLAPRPVALVEPGHRNWTWPTRAYERLGCSGQFMMAADLRTALRQVAYPERDSPVSQRHRVR